MRAGCRSKGAVVVSVAVGRATRAVAKASAGSPRRACSSLQIRSPSAVTGMSVSSIERPSPMAASSDMCGRSSCQSPAPTTVSGFGTAVPARTRRGAVPSAGSNTAWTWACTAVACSWTSIPRGRRRPVTVPVTGASAAPGTVSSRARDHRSAQRRAGIRSMDEPGQDAASSAAKPSRSVARRRSAGSGSIAETTGAAPATTSWSMPCHPERARSDSQERAAVSRFAPCCAVGAGSVASARVRPVASSMRVISASWTEPRSAVRAAARATKWSSLAAPPAAFSAASATLAASGVPATAYASPVRPALWAGCGRSRPATRARSKPSTASRASSSPVMSSAKRSARITPPPWSAGTTASPATALWSG